MSEGDSSLSDVKMEIKFKSKSRKNIRSRKRSSSSEEDGGGVQDEDLNLNIKLGELKEKQKLRSRPNGVSLIGLTLGQKVTIEDEITNKDPFNIKSGGMVNMQALKTGKMKPADDAYDTGIGTQFSAETNKRDEDEEMMKYIELELNKRKGSKLLPGMSSTSQAIDIDNNPTKYLTPEEAALLSLPDHLRNSSTQRSEEMLSNQMLNGIPEIDLGIEAKIKNIEATEEAKQKLLQEQKKTKDGPSQFVPTNFAVNFVQHNRFNIEDSDSRKRRLHHQNRDHEGKHGGGDKDKNVKKATDDYHYDKFKKQFRRY